MNYKHPVIGSYLMTKRCAAQESCAAPSLQVPFMFLDFWTGEQTDMRTLGYSCNL